MDQLRALLALRCPAGLLYQGNCCQYLWVSPLGLAGSPEKFSLFCLGAGTGPTASYSVNTHLTPSFLLVLVPSTAWWPWGQSPLSYPFQGINLLSSGRGQGEDLEI